MRELCKSCDKPIMIVEGKLETKIDTLDIEQVTKFGCLNKECKMFNVVTNETRQPFNQ